jgi:hypothetical protein
MNTIQNGDTPEQWCGSVLDDLAGIEVALGVCNNVSGIISALINEQEESGQPDAEKIARWSEIRYRFLRVEPENFSRDNIAYVREFICIYAPQVKAMLRAGKTPDFLLV